MFDAVSAGHICLDMTPVFFKESGGVKDIFIGGKLTNVGDMTMSTGGSVSNTGIALNLLGIKSPLVTKVGDDMLGEVLCNLTAQGGGITDYIIKAPGESTSYTVVVAPYGVDRMFLHNTGANDTFTEDDVDLSLMENTKLFHFGYPTLMKKMYQNNGRRTVALFKKAKEAGATTSLDLTLPDPSSECGQLDWVSIFKELLPYTDIFLPSIEEIVYMLDRPKYDELKAKSDDILENIELDYISSLGSRIIEMGCSIVVLKCGTLGYYLKTANSDKLERMGRAKPQDCTVWANKELFSGIFKVEDVKSATGAGDTSIAAFLASILKGYAPERAITLACATGALCCTAYGATEAIIPLEQIAAKVDAGWERRPLSKDAQSFSYDAENGIYRK